MMIASVLKHRDSVAASAIREIIIILFIGISNCFEKRIFRQLKYLYGPGWLKLQKKKDVSRESLLGEVGQFLGRAIATRNVMFNQVVADKLGISTTDLRCLDLLDRQNGAPVTAGRITEMTGLSPAATTDMIDRLERAGFVRRERSTLDRRQVLIQQTELAKTSVAPLFDGIQAAMADLAASYTTRDLKVINDFLTRSIAIAREQAEKLRRQGS